MNSLYEQYIKERESLDVIKTDKGFITYRREFPNCTISDLFVLKEFRQEGVGSFLANQVFEICKGAGIKTVYCQVDKRANGHHLSQCAIEAFGFDLIHENVTHKIFSLGVSEWENL